LWLLLATLVTSTLPARGAAPEAVRLGSPQAVVVVGPVDPPANERTRAYIAEAEDVAQILEEAGYQVARLYHPEATWERLREASRGSSLFVYYGHGNGYGWQGYTGPGATNGLCLSDPENPDIVRTGPGVPGGSEDDLASLGFTPGFTVVLVHACYAAGSSQFDDEAVGYHVASRRVKEYAEAFLQAGASRYLATTYVGVAPAFFRRWLTEESPRQAFREVLGGRRIHSQSGMLIAEDRDSPDDPYPWVSALVEEPVEVALASAPQEFAPQEDQPAAEQQQTRRLGDVRRVVAAVMKEERQERKAASDLDLRKDLVLKGEGHLRQESVLLRLVGLQGGEEFDQGLHRDAWSGWGLDNLLALYRGQIGDQWIPTSIFQHGCAIWQAESLAPVAEIVPASIDPAGLGDPVDWLPAGFGKVYYPELAAQIGDQFGLWHMEVLGQSLAQDWIAVNLFHDRLYCIGAPAEERIRPGRLLSGAARG